MLLFSQEKKLNLYPTKH